MSLNAAPGVSKHGVSWVGRACLAAAASTLCRPGCCFRAACAGLVREAHGCRLRCYAGHGLSAGAQWVSMLSSAWGAGGLARAERGATPWYAPPCSGGAALARGDMGCSVDCATPAAWQTRWRLGARVFVQTRAGDSRGQLGVQPGCWREPRGAAACRAPCGLLSEPNLAGRRAGCGCEQLDLWRGGGAQASDSRTLPWRVACWGRADGSFAQSRRIGRLHAAKPMAGSLCHAAGSTSRSCQPRARFSHAAVCVNAAAAAAWGIMP